MQKMKFNHPRNIRFKCTKCALCCGDTEKKARNILLLKIETKRISENTSKKLGDFAEKIKEFEPYAYRMKKTTGGKCVFLEGKSCMIYRSRPLICRFYPFELQNIAKDEYVFIHTDECPGIGNGPLLRKRFFEKLFVEMLKLMGKKGVVNSEF